LELYEKHHIIPKSLNGTNENFNIVKLTPREHFIAHILLTKMVYEKIHKRSMAFALIAMKRSNNKTGYNRVGNSRLYEKIKVTILPLISGENNGFYNDHRFTGSNNPFYGKKHTPETIEKIVSMRKQPVKIQFTNGSVAIFTKKGDIGKYLNISKSMGIQLCTIKKHLWEKYNIKEIIDETIINQKN